MKKIFVLILFFGIGSKSIIAQNNQFLFLSKLGLKSLNVTKIAVKNGRNFFNNGDLNPQFEIINDEIPVLTEFLFKGGFLSNIVCDEGSKGSGYRVNYSYYDSDYLNYFNSWKDNEPKIASKISALLKRSLANKNGPYLKSWESLGKGMPCSYPVYFSKLSSIYVRNCERDEGPMNGSYKIVYKYDSSKKLIAATIDNVIYDLHPFKIQYIYEGNNLVGFYPARPTKIDHIEQGQDSIYNYTKVQEFIKSGFQKFSVQNLSPIVKRKIIEDSYCIVHSNQVLINGLELKQFLKKINRIETRYIVIEVADNFFLFYKLID